MTLQPGSDTTESASHGGPSGQGRRAAAEVDRFGSPVVASINVIRVPYERPQVCAGPLAESGTRFCIAPDPLEPEPSPTLGGEFA